MNRHRARVAALLVIPFVLAARPPAQQQANSPHIGYVYPAGGQQGTTVHAQVGGRFLDGAASVLVSGHGLSARVVGLDKPLNGQQLTTLREKAQELQKKLPNPAVRKELEDLRLRIGESVRRNQNPVLSERVTLEISIARDAQPGTRVLRLGTTLGLTNPLAFIVGQLPEVREIENKTSKADSELAVTLPVVANGRMIPGDVNRLQAPLRQAVQYAAGDVDRYRFSARRGQELVIAVSARELMPYLADAVPGWFQATLTLLDASGRELAYDDDYRFQPDPVLHYRIPSDGEFVVEIKDALFRGREDFVYRVTIGELPFVTGLFPLGGRTGAKTTIELAGWNLNGARVTLDGNGKTAGMYPVSTKAAGLVTNALPFQIDTLPEAAEREPNDSTKTAQQLQLPIVVNGRADKPGDWDVFGFSGRAGDRVVAEVLARRLASPLDSVLALTDAAGRRLAFNDDHDDRGAGLITHQADSLLEVTLPADGTYFVRLGDAQGKGGAEYAYRLRVSAPRPDFDLRVAPSSVNASGGATVPLTVTAIRRDGFAGDIALALKNAPGRFMLSGGVIPAGEDQARVTVTAPPAPSREPMTIGVEGRAVIGGKTVVREALAAEDMMQAFAYRHLVPSDDLWVAVIGRGATRVSSRVLGAQPVKIPAGGAARVRASFPPAYRLFQHLELELSEPPDGITLSDLRLVGNGAEFVLQADPAKITAGRRGNLIVIVSGQRTPAATAQQPTPVSRRVPLGVLPAISYEIVER
jgi:hypothetical protein